MKLRSNMKSIYCHKFEIVKTRSSFTWWSMEGDCNVYALFTMNAIIIIVWCYSAKLMRFTSIWPYLSPFIMDLKLYCPHWSMDLQYQRNVITKMRLYNIAWSHSWPHEEATHDIERNRWISAVDFLLQPGYSIDNRINGKCCCNKTPSTTGWTL